MNTNKKEYDQDFFKIYDLNDGCPENILSNNSKKYFSKNNNNLYINLLGDD